MSIFNWVPTVPVEHPGVPDGPDGPEETPVDSVLVYRIDPVTQQRHMCVVTKEVAVLERLERALP